MMRQTAEKKRSKVDVTAMKVMLMDEHRHVQEVADTFGVSRQRIYQLRRENNINIHRPIEKICKKCGKEFTVNRSRARNKEGVYCSTSCYIDDRREFADYQPNRQGQRIARKTIEQSLGYSLPDWCVVHHEDGDNANNNLDNLTVFPSQTEHLRYHHSKRYGTATKPYGSLTELPDKIEGWTRFKVTQLLLIVSQ